MTHTIIARIVDVYEKNGTCNVVFYHEDKESLCEWEGTPPVIGSVFEIDPERPGRDARKLGEPARGAWTTDNDALIWRKRISATGSLTRNEVLRQRHRIRRSVRDYLDSQGYIEIEAPLLVRGTTPDVEIESFKVGDHYLSTSTEYQIKRLAVGGLSRIYTLTKNFRMGDVNATRNPEFTMLEWGGIDRTLRDIENEAEAIVTAGREALELPLSITYQGRSINLKTPWDRMPVAEAIERATGVAMPDFEIGSCIKAAQAARLDIKPAWSANRDFIFSMLTSHIQPMLGLERPVFLTHWPAFQTTSASTNATAPGFVDRSELFIGGLELSDGFTAVTDSDTQEALFEKALAIRDIEGKPIVELDEKYIASLRLFSPYGAGMALGFDRMVMLLTDQNKINSVLAFGWDEL